MTRESHAMADITAAIGPGATSMALAASSGALHCELAIARPTPGQPVAAPQAAGTPLWEFPPAPAGGGAHLADRTSDRAPGRAITWAIAASSEAAAARARRARAKACARAARSAASCMRPACEGGARSRFTE